MAGSHLFPTAVWPLAAVMGFAVAGATYRAIHATQAPDVIWSRRNPKPFESIKQNETPKIYDPNGKFEKKWSRTSSFENLPVP
ncbi:hypothetical protein HDV00_011101 [Rhizophlyctis rosea]|nr:hypothetical protein HDV00_011101 [Rhizophlyctis rosea]